ncbi:hypothetical protein WG899_03540 [Paucibacter sp. AS339]|uniref:hypothetical protein n=1 Tax=Paucibacter hankyongi TaxID=3133434 RepID=UPI0030AD7264
MLPISGLAWLWIHLGRAEDALPSVAEPWLMRLHGLASFLTLLALGAIGGTHIPAGWKLTRRHRRIRQRNTGLLLSGLLGLSVLTAYVLYYFAPEGLREPLGWTHALLGLLSLPAWWLHRRRKKS